MNKFIRIVLSCFAASVLIFVGETMYCEEYQFEDNYVTSHQEPWSIKENSSYNGGKYVELYTRTPSENGYYIEYPVTLYQGGTYKLTIDCNELGGNVYCEIYVSVNGGKLYNLYTCTGVGIPQSSGLDKLTMNYLGGFKDGENIIRFTVLNSRPRDTLYIAHLDCFSLEKVGFGIENIDITGDTASNIVEYGNNVGAVLNFSEVATEDISVNISINDYYDKTVFNTDYMISAGTLTLTADFGVLDKGHYTVIVRSEENIFAQRFISVVTPISRRIKFSDTPFGIDTAFSIVAPQESIEDNLMAFKLTGATWMRDRLILSSIGKSGDVWNFEGGYVDEVLTKASGLDIKTHLMLQSMPNSVLDSDSGANSEYITKNYPALYDLGKQMAEYYSGRVATFEIFNEPDTSIGSSDNETGDKFADFVKALALGIYEANTGAGVTAPGYSAIRTEPLEIALRNKMFDYVDVGAYHNHQTYNSEYETQSLKISPTENYNNLIKSYGYNEMQNWLDESGISMGQSEMSSLGPAEQRKQAAFYIMSICEGLAKGSDKVFSYLFKDKRSRFSWFSRFNEGPNRVYTAYSVMTDILGEGECLGTLSCFDKAEGYVFKNGAKQVLVICSAENLSVEIPISTANAEIIKADGTTAVKYPNNGYITVSLSSDPVFVSINGEYDENLYTPREKKIRDFETTPKSFSGAEKILIHQTYPSETRLNAKYDGYQLSDETVVAVEVSNLNSTAKTGTIYAELFDGWKIYPTAQNITVEAYNTETLYFMVSKTSDVAANQKSAVIFRGEFDGENTMESVTEIVSEGEIEYRQTSSIPSVLEDDNWKMSNAAGTEVSLKTTEVGLTFKIDFSVSASDKWAYPFISFSELQDFSGADGVLIKYSAKESFFDYEKLTLGVWLGEKDGGRYINSYTLKLDKGENVFLIPFSKFTYKNGYEIDNILTTDNIDYISIGVNSKGYVLDIPEFTITDFGLYTADEYEGRYAKIASAEICDEPLLNSKYGRIKICFEDSDSPVDLSTVKVYIDGVECKTYEDGGAVYAVLHYGVLNGEHKIYVSYAFEDTKAFYEEFTISFENFAVLAESKPVIWYKEAEELDNLSDILCEKKETIFASNGAYIEFSSDTELICVFEIPKDGYYELYASAGDTSGEKYTQCVFEIENVHTFDLDNDKIELANENMAYYSFDSVYLPKGSYKLFVSAETGTTALDYVGLIYDYEVVSRVEGENYSGITFENYGVSTNNGVTYLYANSKSEQDGESYGITYSVSVPYDGKYILCANTSPTDSFWYSQYRFVIDGEIILNSHYSTKAGADAGEIRSYKYGEVYLSSGEHTIEIIVDTRRLKGSPLGYYFWIDCIELRKKVSHENTDTEYLYDAVNFENIYDRSVSPDIFRKTSDENGCILSLDVIRQGEIQQGDTKVKRFTVRNTDSLKSVYIFDREKELKPLGKPVIFE